MSPVLFACRSLLRQPARTLLGIGGIAAVGALLFDMLMLSNGLIVSFGDLLDSVGFDVRVTATEDLPGYAPPIEEAHALAAAMRNLPGVAEVIPMRFGSALAAGDGQELQVDFFGVGASGKYPWTVLRGEGLDRPSPAGPPPILVNRNLAARLDIAPGDTLVLRGVPRNPAASLPPTSFEVRGIVSFPFDTAGQMTAATRLEALVAATGALDDDRAHILMIRSRPGVDPEATVSLIRDAHPDVHPFTNRQFLDRFERTDFSYFRVVSFALSSMTLFFSFLLVTTLLTVSVNQRFVEVATLRALGFGRRWVASHLLWESVLLVGAGGLLALPLGWLLARWLDAILREMPMLPERLHFFVFQIDAVARYAGLMAATGLLAAAYPVFLAARLPIAPTLRREVVS